MRLTITGRNIDITPSIREYVEEKIGRISNHYDQIMSMEVILTVNKNPSVEQNHVADVTIYVNGQHMHVTESAESMYAAIDLAADKVNRQVIKYKERLIKSKRKNDSIRTENYETSEEERDLTEEIKNIENE